MRPPRVRFTVRRLMASVAVAAILVASYLHVRNSYLRNRYIAASKEHSTYARYCEEGRVTAIRYLEKSRSLMEAQIALCSGERDRAACVAANLDRAGNLMKQLNDETLGVCTKGLVGEIAEIQEYIDQVRLQYGVESGEAPESEGHEVGATVLP